MIQPIVVMKSKTLPLLLTLVFATHLHAQRGPQDTWFEKAISVKFGYNTDGYFSTSGFFSDLIVTPEGTFLLADTNKRRIIEYQANGSFIRHIAVSGSDNPNNIEYARELAMGPNNRIYLTDSRNHRIQIRERDGTFVSQFGTYGSGDGQFNFPYGLDISLDNEVFVSDYLNHRVQVFDADGNFLRKWGSLGNLDGQMNKPTCLEVDEDGKVFVADRENRRINVYSALGEFLYSFKTLFHIGQNIHMKLYTSGILATTGDYAIDSDIGSGNHLILREKDGNIIRSIKINSPTHSSIRGGVSTQLDNGTILYSAAGKSHLIVFEQTHRALKPATHKNLPMVNLISVKQPAGTHHLEIKYKITDTDSSTVNCGLLAFSDGGNDLSKVLIPTTFVGSTTGKLGSSTTTGVTHTVTWNAAAYWDVLLGDMDIAVVAQDDRELMNFHFLTLPATDTNSTALKINRSPVGHGDFKNAWYTLLALGDSGITLDGNEIKSTSGVAFTTSSGTITNAEGRKYLFNKMNLREATTSEIDRAKEGATPGVINQFDPYHKVGPDERPNKVNEYGFDTGGSGFWVVPQS